jgi:predicted esterase
MLDTQSAWPKWGSRTSYSRLLRVAGLLCIASYSFAVTAHANDPPQEGYTASATNPRGTVKVTGTLLPPRSAAPLRGAIVVLRWALGTSVFNDPEWRQLANELNCGFVGVLVGNTDEKENRPIAEQAIRNAAIGGAEALQAVLAELGKKSGHPELERAKLILWGHSAAGSFVATFGALQPNRTVGFIRYHSNSRGLPLDMNAIARQPALLFAGEKDDVAGVEDTEQLWRSGRALGAPWAFVVEPGTPHGSPELLKNANQLAIPWVRAIFARRVPENSRLLAIKESRGWYGLAKSREIEAANAFHGAPHDASWFPDEITAKRWRELTGIHP